MSGGSGQPAPPEIYRPVTKTETTKDSLTQFVTVVTCNTQPSHLQERYYARFFFYLQKPINEHAALRPNGVDADLAFTVEEVVLQPIFKRQNPTSQDLSRAQIRTTIPCISLLLLFFFLLSLSGAAQVQNERRVLRTIREVNQLTNLEARNAFPVQLDAIVTYSDPEWGLLFVEDSSGAIYVNVHGMNLSFGAGGRVKIDAVTGPGDVDTVLVNPHVEILGKGDLPMPERRSLSEINAQKADSRLVVTRGVLRAGDQPWKRVCFRIFDGDVSALVVVPQLSSQEARQLVGATVRVRGVAGVHIDEKAKSLGQ
jgi:hypothetical protein